MTRYVALLRGINVGGNNLIRMPALKAAFEAEGFDEVATYIQSGNVLFRPRAARSELAARIEAMLADAFDYVPTVVVRSRKQMQAVVAGAPKGFGDPARDVPVRRHLPEGAAVGEDGDQGRAHEPGRRRGAAGTGVLYFSRLTAKATASRLNSDRLVADLSEGDDRQLEHHHEACSR